MDEQIRQIAERLRGLRDVLELTADDIARDCDISAEEYRLAETGEFDISVSMLQKIARHYGISLDALMFGQEPKMSSYFLTRAGKGTSIERTKAYKIPIAGSRFHQPHGRPVHRDRRTETGQRADTLQQPYRSGVQPRTGRPYDGQHRRQRLNLKRRRQSILQLQTAARHEGA